jgi:tetratricopeptide (TPR) repeat protein
LEKQKAKNELLLKELMLKGKEYYHKEDYDKAIDCYDKVLEIDPKHTIACGNKGLALSKLGKHNEAIECYDKVLEVDYDSPIAWYSKGVALDKLRKHKEAIECYEKALKIDPKYTQAWNNKAVILHDLGKHKEAIECYEKALKIVSNDADAWYNKGTALSKLGKHNEAVECYDKALEINPKHAEAWHNKGLRLVNLGKYNEAIECYDKGLKINPKLTYAWYGKGIALFYLGKYNEAIECYDKGLKINPNDLEVMNIRDMILKEMEKQPQCGDLQQKKTPIGINTQSIGVHDTGGDVLGTAISGSGNIIAKDTKGNIFNFYIQNLSFEQLQNIITSSLEISPAQTADNTRRLNNVIQTKQQAGQMLEEIKKIEEKKGTEIQEIKVGEVHISKNDSRNLS